MLSVEEIKNKLYFEIWHKQVDGKITVDIEDVAQALHEACNDTSPHLKWKESLDLANERIAKLEACKVRVPKAKDEVSYSGKWDYLCGFNACREEVIKMNGGDNGINR